MTPTATEIAAWANSRDSQARMPILLRRLIHGSVPEILEISFPGGDSVQLGGFDGMLATTTGTPWVPDGKSVWESGCNKQVKAKADSDYKKRTTRSRAKERRATTFIFVTPRRWTKKKTWAETKKAEKKWKDVRCLDADDIEQWAEVTPSAAAWLAEQIGSRSIGFITAQRYWAMWANVCKPPLPRDLLLASRGHQVTDLAKALQSSPNRVTTIAADSREEALAFACAALSLDEYKGLGDRMIVADASSPVERLQERDNVIVALQTEALERRMGALAEKLHIIVPRARGETDEPANIELEPLKPDAFDKCLEELGLSPDEITSAARESGRSISVLRRRWAISPALRQPAWAGNTDTAREFVPFALCGAWNADREGDLATLAGLSNRSKDTIEHNLADLLAMDDSPIEAIGPVNRVLSPIEAIFAIGRRITRSDLDRFFEFAEKVYGVRDPALDLPEDKRWMANILGKEHPFSGVLLHGLGNTLILLAIYGNSICGNRLNVNIATRVHVLVGTLLTDLTPDQWLSIRGTLRLLAEAAPDAFLSAIERDLAKPSPSIMSLMRVMGDGFATICLRSELLWALELLGWDSASLFRVAQILAQLSRYPISDNWGNRPSSSLLALFRAWLPKTAAPIEKRIEVLRQTYARYPDVGFALCIKLVDHRLSHAIDNARPRWRGDATGAGRSVTRVEYEEMIVAAADLLLEVERSLPELEELIEHYVALPPQYKLLLWSRVHSWIETSPNDEDKATLREVIRRHALSRRAKMRAGGADTAQAKAAFDRLLPAKLTARHRWLFESHWVDFAADELEGEVDFEARQRRIDAARNAAMREVWSADGLGGFIDFACSMNSPQLVGLLLAKGPPKRLSNSKVVAVALAHSRPERADAFIRGFLSAISKPRLQSVLQRIHSAHHEGKLDAAAALRVFRSAPTRKVTWQALEKETPDFRSEYWRTALIGWSQWPADDANFLVNSLLEAKRPRTAFYAAHPNWKHLGSDLILRLLEAVTSIPEAGVALPDAHMFEEAFDRLDTDPGVERGRVARLEFAIAPALLHGKRGPAALFDQLRREPILFVEMLSHIFRRDDGGTDPEEWRITDPEAARDVSELCWRVIDGWHHLPGVHADGTVDADALKSWVSDCRKLCHEHGRRVVGDHTIGRLLAHAPNGSDGIWPCFAVRQILEQQDADELSVGVHIGVNNKRGVTTRDPYEGGEQERRLAARFEADASAVSADWPRTAVVLRKVAEDYRRQAELHDKDAQLNQRSDL